METGHLHDTTHNYGLPQAIPSIALYICSWLFIYLETLTVEAVWTWTFRALSGISLLLIIYINWSKAKEIFKGKRPKENQSPNSK
jgi:hypothetical protein